MFPAADAPREIDFRLSNGMPPKTETPPTDAAPPAEVEKLSERETAALLARLPKEAPAATSKLPEFRFPAKSLPPPQPGRTVEMAFPASGTAAPPDGAFGKTFDVARFAPEGPVELAPNLSVTFTQPMIPLESVSDAAAERPPVEITPQPPGRWRWIGTRTLLFEPDGRFPMATTYRVRVPAGVTSAVGGTLARETAWTFTTPTVSVTETVPGKDAVVGHKPLIFLGFNQRIDPAAVASVARVKAGGKTFRVRQARPDELSADKNVTEAGKNAQAGRFGVFRVVDDAGADAVLPPDAGVSVVIEPGLASLEGPNRTVTEIRAVDFRTHGPLVVTGIRCGGLTDLCAPNSTFVIDFSNSLDAKTVRADRIAIEPPLPDGQALEVAVYNRSISIGGRKAPNTRYRVTLPETIRDEFGQPLGATAPLVFNVEGAPRFFYVPALDERNPLTIFDPFGGRRLSVISANHDGFRMTVRRVNPTDWPKYFGVLQRRNMREKFPEAMLTPPGEVVFSEVVPIQRVPNDFTETTVNLGRFLRDGVGNLIVTIETVPDPMERQQTFVKWCAATDIGLDAVYDWSGTVVRATSLKTGRPLAGVEVTDHSTGAKATTGADGLARLGPSKFETGVPLFFSGRLGTDEAVLSEEFWRAFNGLDHSAKPDPRYVCHVFDDRGLYQPGEEVSVKGWLRSIEPGPTGDTVLSGLNGKDCVFVVTDSQQAELAKGACRIGPLGGFDLRFTLPQGVNSGWAGIAFNIQDGPDEVQIARHSFLVAEFRRPEFEVDVKPSSGPFFAGDPVDLTLTAKYFAGGGLGSAKIGWRVVPEDADFAPPGWDGFTFGEWRPWWIFGVNRYSDSGSTGDKERTFDAVTDADGRHTLRVHLDRVTPPAPVVFRVEGSVQDVNRQTVTGMSRVLVHPASVYLGLRGRRTFVDAGQPLVVDSVVTDVDGKAVAGRPVRFRFSRVEYKKIEGEWREVEVDAVESETVSTGGPAEQRFQPAVGGRYRLAAVTTDVRERVNQSVMTFWVAGETSELPRISGNVELIPDKREYRAGETAEILVRSSISDSDGLLVLDRDGIVTTEHFTMTGTTHTLRIPIREEWTPNVHLSVRLVGTRTRADRAGKPRPDLPAFPVEASATLELAIPPVSRTLSVTAAPRDAVTKPGAGTAVDVMVRDAAGAPVEKAEVALVVVDEAVLALRGYTFLSPIEAFYPNRLARAEMLNGRKDVREEESDRIPLSGDPSLTAMVNSQTATTQILGLRVTSLPLNGRNFLSLVALTPGVAGSSAIQLRRDFNPLAVFAPTVMTDAAGKAVVNFKLPDNLTRYRVVAVAATDKRFGIGESNLTARLPLMARPSAPRFLNFGDRFELPVVVQNQTDRPLPVTVAVRATNATLTDGAGRRVTIPANNRVEVRFPVAAGNPGTANFAVAVTGGAEADAAFVSLPVYTPATTEAFATYGELDAGATAQPISAPRDAVKGFGGLEVTTSATEMQSLTDAVKFQTSYPYSCSEQIASRMLTVAALEDLLREFNVPGISTPEAAREKMKEDIADLLSREEDGGFGLWVRGSSVYPYVSVHCAHALVRAKARGMAVPEERFERCLEYLDDIESNCPSEYGPAEIATVTAYALYVRSLMKDEDVLADARKFLAKYQLKDIPLECTGWLLNVFASAGDTGPERETLRRFLFNRVTETAGTAHFADGFTDANFVTFRSNLRADGVILDALIADSPQSDLIPKLVRGLLGSRINGCWGNTQENLFILLGMERYFRTFEKAVPDFVARVWLDERFAGERAFRGRTTDRAQLDIPLAALGEGRRMLTLAKTGAGRMYYRIGLRYAPANFMLKPYAAGFSVTRIYLPVDDPSDVRRDPDGTWRIRAGARVKVKVLMETAARRTQVALVDPLPAGFEALNPELQGTGALPDSDEDESGEVTFGRSRWWSWQWYDHQNLRTERAEAFANVLWEGSHTFVYFARATTPGEFIAPPSKAEEMYHPETFGRGATDRVVVERALPASK